MAVETKPNDIALHMDSLEETHAKNEVLENLIKGRNIIQKSYAQFNNRTLYDTLDDWTKRWNGYIPPASVMLDATQSRIFLNFTRNSIVSYLAKVALQHAKVKIKAVNKQTGLGDKKLGSILEDLNDFSLYAENGDARYMEAALELAIKGTVVVYEGYARRVQKEKVPKKFDAETGKIILEEKERVIFDNCFQEIVPIEDFYIANPYQPDIQKQPFIIWKKITTLPEAELEYKKYPNFKHVKPGQYTLTSEPTTFYRNKMYTELSDKQVEILRYYNRSQNQHIVLINGVVMYDGPIPFKDGKYPFAKGIFEPFENQFFWGMGFPQKIMGEQDLMITFINMMADKTFGSLLPYGLSSDLDDFIEDDTLMVNKIRKVGDINKWKFDTLPGVNSSEQSMFQMILNLARENSGDITGAGGATTARGGKLSARQLMMKQQESMQRLGFSMNFMEDFERDRTQLRVSHIIQFYSIPKIEKITNKRGKEVEQMLYRDAHLENVRLEDGRTGNRIIKLVGQDAMEPDAKQKLADELSVTEMMGDEIGVPTEALAVSVNTFNDFNFDIQIIKNSSFERNQTLDQAVRHEYVDWRIQMMQLGVPVDLPELVAWVDESYDVDSDRFTPKQGTAPQPNAMQPGAPPGNPPAPGAPGLPQGLEKKGPQKMSPAQAMAPSRVPSMNQLM